MLNSWIVSFLHIYIFLFYECISLEWLNYDIYFYFHTLLWLFQFGKMPNIAWNPHFPLKKGLEISFFTCLFLVQLTLIYFILVVIRIRSIKLVRPSSIFNLVILQLCIPCGILLLFMQIFNFWGSYEVQKYPNP